MSKQEILESKGSKVHLLDALKPQSQELMLRCKTIGFWRKLMAQDQAAQML